MKNPSFIKTITNHSLTTFGRIILSINMLAVIFTALRLAKIIDWSWWLILLPTWGPAAYFTLVIGGCTICMTAAAILNHIDKPKTPTNKKEAQ